MLKTFMLYIGSEIDVKVATSLIYNQLNVGEV
jgi:hypothetical protein